ncbi:chorismate mutase [Mycolicibacillus koreensis]
MRPEPTNSQRTESPAMATETSTEKRPSSHPTTDIDDLRGEIDRLDAEILAAVKRRTEVSQAIGRARMASGGTRLVHSREMKVIERYSELGPDGKDLAMLLLRMGRGRLGH